MKKIILILVFAVYGFFTYSQNCLNILDDFGYPEINGLNIESIGNNYYIQYIFIDSSFSQGIGILKLDSSGNLIKKIEFIDTAFWYGSYPSSNFMSTSDSFIIMAANRFYNQSIRKEKVEIWKFNTNLDTIWTKLIDHPDTTEANLPNSELLVRVEDIVKCCDNNIVLSISYNRKCMDPTNSQNRRALLMKIDTNGNILWVNRNNEIFVQLVEIVSSNDSGFYSPAAISTLPYKLNKFDKYGNYQWSVDANNLSTQTHTISCHEYGDSLAIMATYYKRSSQIGDIGISISKINTINKVVIWNKNFVIAENMASNAYLNNVPMKVFVHEKGIFIATSGLHTTYNPWYESKYYGIILKVNSNGDSLWTKYYNYNGNGIFDTELQGFMIEDNGSFVGVGYGMLQSGSSQKLWFFKTDTNAYLGFDNAEINENDFIRVYPNPTSNFINIELNNIIYSDIKLEIYDITGRIVILQKFVYRNKYELDISKLSTGIYLLNISTDDGENIKSEKIIKN